MGPTPGMFPQGLTVDNPIQQRQVLEGRGINNNLFAAAMLRPDISYYLSIQHPERLMTTFLDYFEGRSKPTTQAQFQWGESQLGRTKGQIASVDTAYGSSTITVTLVSGTERCFIPGRVAFITSAFDPTNPTRLRTGIRAYVVSKTGTQLVLSKRDGTVWNAAEISATLNAPNSFLGSAYTPVGEASRAPDEWEVLPEFKENNLTTIRRKYSISGDALTSVTWFPESGFWFWTKQWEEFMEFRKDEELQLMQNDKVDSGILSGEGWMDTIVANGTVRAYGGPLAKSDLFYMAKPLNRNAIRPEYLMLCGNSFIMDAQAALENYALESSAVPEMTTMIQETGVKIRSFEVYATTMHMAHYRILDDPEVFTNDTSTTGSFGGGAYRDYSATATLINMGTGTDGAPLIRMRHKETGMGSRKFVFGYQPGLTGAFGMASDPSLEELEANVPSFQNVVVSDVDAHTCHFLSQKGIELRLAYQHGQMYQNS